MSASGWAAYNRIDTFLMVPTTAIGQASTTFVAQNWGAQQPERARKGVRTGILLSLGCMGVCAVGVILLARPLLSIISPSEAVISFGARFLYIITPFYLVISFNQMYAGALRGIGESVVPTVIMLFSFVVFRQIYLYLATTMIADEQLRFVIVELAYPVAMVDGDSGRLLYGKEAQTALPNASTTKILTCIVAMEQCKPDEVVTFSAKAASQPKVHLGAKKGEQFYMQDLWYGLMLESYNDCAYAIAEHVAGSAEKFAALMNEKAKKIGCTDSHFVTPNGLDAKDEQGEHHTTAYDLCRIMSYCAWKSPVSKQFLEVTQTRSHTFQSLEGTGYAVSNKNALLDMMDHVITGKTGYTSKAGYCYVAALEEGGRHYAIALLACGWPNHKNYKWSDAKTLFQYGMDAYHLYRGSEASMELPEIEIAQVANFPSEPVSYLPARILRAYFPRYFGKILENPQRIFSAFPFISQKI